MLERIQNKFLPANDIGAAMRRFPLSFACCVLIYATVVFAGGLKSALGVMPLILGYFWFGIVVLISESKGFSIARQLILAFSGYAVLVVILYAGWNWPHQNFHILLLCLLMALCYAPFINSASDDRDFWVFNRSLWFSSVNAIVMGMALSLGITAIVGSVAFLFGANLLPSLSYVYLFVWLVYVPGLALIWVPKAGGDEDIHFGRECHVLVYWILTPFLTVYTVILYAYAFKIGIFMELPKGKLSTMVLAFALVGLMTYMASWPVRANGGNVFQKNIQAFFMALLLPLGLMGLAIGVRIQQYGVTPDRYLLAVSLICLLTVALLYMRRGTAPMKYILMIFTAGLLLSSFGPWGAAAISNYSQTARLTKILEHAGILSEGQIIEADKDQISDEVQRDISGRVNYLMTAKKLHRVHPDFKQFYGTGTRDQGNRAVQAMNFMGLDLIDRRGKVAKPQPEGVSFSFFDKGILGDVTIVTGYDVLFPRTNYFSVRLANEEDWKRNYEAGQGGAYPSVTFRVTPQAKLYVRIGENSEMVFDIQNHIVSLLEGMRRDLIPVMTQTGPGGMTGTLEISNIRGVQVQNGIHIQHFNFRFMLTL